MATSAGRAAGRGQGEMPTRYPCVVDGTAAMDSELARYLQQQLRRRGKSLYFLAEFTGLDIRYLRRLASGEKRNPSTEALVKIAFALVACEEEFRRDPRLPLVLGELLLAGGYTAVGSSRSV